MTLEELHNLVSELHERHEDDTEVFVASYDPRKPENMIVGHFESVDGWIVLVTATVPKPE